MICIDLLAVLKHSGIMKFDNGTIEAGIYYGKLPMGDLLKEDEVWPNANRKKCCKERNETSGSNVVAYLLLGLRF